MMYFEDAFAYSITSKQIQLSQIAYELCLKNNENVTLFRFYVGMLCRIYEINVIVLIISTKVRKLPSFWVYAG